MVEKPLERVLVVVEAVADYGPVTLAELTQRLPFSRASIWRILWVLRKRGWVKQKHESGHHVICEGIVRQLKMADWQTADVAKIDPLILKILSIRVEGLRAYDIQYGAFTSKGVFEILESTIKDTHNSNMISLVNNELSLGAQMTMPDWLLSEHLSSYIKISNESEVDIILSGEHERKLKQQKEINKVMIFSENRVTFSTSKLTGSHSSLRVISRGCHKNIGDNKLDDIIELVSSYL